MRRIDTEYGAAFNVCGSGAWEELIFNEDCIAYHDEGAYQLEWEGIGEYDEQVDESIGFRLARRA